MFAKLNIWDIINGTATINQYRTWKTLNSNSAKKNDRVSHPTQRSWVNMDIYTHKHVYTFCFCFSFVFVIVFLEKDVGLKE